MQTMPFGKYRGRPLDDLPTNYLVWLIDNTDIDDSLSDAIHTILEDRRGGRYKRSTRSNPPVTPRLLSPPPGVRLEHVREMLRAGRKAMARKHHPDLGGDTETMAAVNNAGDWLESLVAGIVPEGRRR